MLLTLPGRDCVMHDFHDSSRTTLLGSKACSPRDLIKIVWIFSRRSGSWTARNEPHDQWCLKSKPRLMILDPNANVLARLAHVNGLLGDVLEDIHSACMWDCFQIGRDEINPFETR